MIEDKQLNYCDKYYIMSEMSKNYRHLFQNLNGFAKNSKSLVLYKSKPEFEFENYNFPSEYEKVFIRQLLKEEVDLIKNKYEDFSKSKYFKPISFIDNSFFNLVGKQWQNLRTARNKYEGKIIIKKELNDINEAIKLIELWDSRQTSKYTFSGFDKTFFNKYYFDNKENFICYFYYDSEKLIGFSISRNMIVESNTVIKLLIRKVDIEYKQFSIYVDLKTLELINNKLQQPFYNDWGIGDKGILEYKHQFPCYKTLEVYHVNFKNPNYKFIPLC